MPLLAGCSEIDPCENVVVKTVFSPDKSHKVVVFTRGCGATTSDSTQVSLLRANEEEGNSGNALVFKDERDVEVTWKDDHTVELAYSWQDPIFQEAQPIDGVWIKFVR